LGRAYLGVSIVGECTSGRFDEVCLCSSRLNTADVVACSGGLSRTVSSAPQLSRRRAACDHRLTSTEIGSLGSPETPSGRTDGQRFMANVVMGAFLW